jgi:hypothetical protein
MGNFRVDLSASLGAMATVTAVVWLAPVPVWGQTSASGAKAAQTTATKTWTPPRTAGGQPDLQGVWLNNGATPLERPKALEGKQFLTDDEVTELKRRADRLFTGGISDIAGGDNPFLAALANPEIYKNPNGATGTSDEMIERVFDNRTSLISDPPDGKIPPLTPEAQQRQAAADLATRRAAGPEDLSNVLRCITYGVPRLGGNFGAGIFGYYQIQQTPRHVVLITESIHEARIIPLDGRAHLPSGIRQWNGDPRGRWEGNTLVVETTNFSPRSYFMGSAENLRLVERFTRVAPDTIHYEIVLDDPTTWTKPWTAAIHLRQSRDEIYEFACHEGNYDVMRGVLAGARAEDRAAGDDGRNGAK